MEIEVDYNPYPKNTFFISVALNKKEAISFDYTTKGHRIIKQILVEKKKFPRKAKIDGEWDALVLKDKKFIKKYHVKWIDLDKRDWANNDLWEIAWEKPISNKLKKELLKYSQFISDNYKRLDNYKKRMEEFEQLLTKEISRLK